MQEDYREIGLIKYLRIKRFENETVEEVQCSTESSLQWIGEPAQSFIYE